MSAEIEQATEPIRRLRIRLSFEFILRIIGMLVFAILGLRAGVVLGRAAGEDPQLWGLVGLLLGALIGLILTPYITTRPALSIRDTLSRVPAEQLMAGVLGLILGLAIAALLALPLSLLPAPWSAITPVAAAILFSYFGTTIMAMRRRDIFDLFRGQLPNLIFRGAEDEALTPNRQVLLDTSVIIDGRIADISQTGFVMGPMLVPNFVLGELQHIADSSDRLRRNRGRRGLDMLNRLQKESLVPVHITDMDVDGVDAVDEKLIILAKQLGSAIVTNDFNLNRIAELQGVVVLNINELANAVKTVVLPGEDIHVNIIQEGREYGQGVGYLEDGTMVVVEDGRQFIGETVPVLVTKVLQTAAGRMIFAKPEEIT